MTNSWASSPHLFCQHPLLWLKQHRLSSDSLCCWSVTQQWWSGSFITELCCQSVTFHIKTLSALTHTHSHPSYTCSKLSVCVCVCVCVCSASMSCAVNLNEWQILIEFCLFFLSASAFSVCQITPKMNFICPRRIIEQKQQLFIIEDDFLHFLIFNEFHWKLCVQSLM